MLTLIRRAEVYAPEPLGQKDVLLTGGKICAVRDAISLETDVPTTTIDGTGKLLFPGFIDSHVHIAGGGGEGGFHTRTPEIALTDITLGGVTTVVGTLGTDGICRSMQGLLAKAKALEEEGISTYVQTGNYQIPVRTVTGSVTDDIMLIDKVIGVGEIAVADHRSSSPTADELARLAADARLGGMLSGKAGFVNIHMGDSLHMLELIEEVLKKSDIPIKHFVPTHMNRNEYLFQRSKDFLRNGGSADFTTSTVPQFLEEGEVAAGRTIRILLDEDVPLGRVTFSSDGQGSLPRFDENGKTVGVDVGKVTSLYEAVRDTVLLDRVPVETAISVITSNPADILCLPAKGRVREGGDADLVLVDRDGMHIDTVIAKGEIMVQAGKAVIKGTFE